MGVIGGTSCDSLRTGLYFWGVRSFGKLLSGVIYVLSNCFFFVVVLVLHRVSHLQPEYCYSLVPRNKSVCIFVCKSYLAEALHPSFFVLVVCIDPCKSYLAEALNPLFFVILVESPTVGREVIILHFQRLLALRSYCVWWVCLLPSWGN